MYYSFEPPDPTKIHDRLILLHSCRNLWIEKCQTNDSVFLYDTLIASDHQLLPKSSGHTLEYVRADWRRRGV